MRFRRKGILFWEGQIFVFIGLIVSVALMVFDRKCVSSLLIPSFLLVTAFMSQFFLEKEYIIMNEEGIACQKGNQLYWKYLWSEIAELKIASRYRNPSVEIALKTNRCNKKGEVEPIETYFQLGLAAKKAIKIYCKCPVKLLDSKP